MVHRLNRPTLEPLRWDTSDEQWQDIVQARDLPPSLEHHRNHVLLPAISNA